MAFLRALASKVAPSSTTSGACGYCDKSCSSTDRSPRISRISRFFLGLRVARIKGVAMSDPFNALPTGVIIRRETAKRAILTRDRDCANAI